MFGTLISNFQKKSLKERFLLLLGILFFLCYFVLGCMLLFWNKIPLNISQNARYSLGILVIVYSFIRFIRLIKNNEE
jgi:uncharacterized membrane protein (DUF485 family)